jgi:hypothetical protein
LASVLSELVLKGLGRKPLVPERCFMGPFLDEFFKRKDVLLCEFLNGNIFNLAEKLCSCTVEQGLRLFGGKSRSSLD